VLFLNSLVDLRPYSNHLRHVFEKKEIHLRAHLVRASTENEQAV
jgi:hypothetical protein